MPEGITAENLMNNIMETLSKNVSKNEHASLLEEESKSVAAQFDRLFGREKPVHHLLGGGKSADVLLWRNKKISASVLASATIVWTLFEWLNYNLLALVCFVLVMGMIAQFLWTNASGVLVRGSSSNVPRLVLPEEVFVNVGKLIGAEVNRGLNFLQDISCGGNTKQLLLVLASLWAAAIIGSWCNFLTVLYIGFVAAHTLPVLYEKYEAQVDGFVYNVVGQLHHNYRKLDARVLSRIPTGKFKGKKCE